MQTFRTSNFRLLLVLSSATIACLSNGQAAEHRSEAAKARTFNSLLTDVVREHLPREYEDNRHWGMTTKRWDGLHVHREGWEIKTRRRWKEVNDGTWRRYRITLPEPEQNFSIQVGGARQGKDNRVAFDVTTNAALDAFARLSQWEKGVQLISLSVDATARVEVKLTLETAIRFDHDRFPPDVVLEPEATAIEFRLLDFQVHRLSKMDGPMARDLGKRLQGAIERKLQSKQADSLKKVNRQIAKNQDRLRLSAAEFASGQWKNLKEHVDTVVDPLP
jgi:hypothetical protein